MLNVLFEGWTRFPHSYCIVNVNQLVAMARKKDSVKLYRIERPPYSSSWKIYDSMENILLTAEENALLDSIELWDGKKKIDVVWRSWFPYDVSESPVPGVPVAVQYTAEFSVIMDEYMTFPNKATDFIRRCEEGTLIGITPSLWCTPALKDRKHSWVVPHGVDTKKFYPCSIGSTSIRRSLNIPLDDFVFLNVGAMTGNKNIRGILHGFYLIARDCPRLWLVLKGIESLYACNKNVEGALASMIGQGFIDKQIWDEKVGKRVLYIDGALSYKSLNDIYNIANCYITPYSAEGFNIPALEAQACGIPILATKGGPTDEFLCDQGSTLFIPSKVINCQYRADGRQLYIAIEDLVSCMIKVVNENRQIKGIAMTAGIDHVNKHFTWDRVTDMLLEGLNALVTKNINLKE